MNERFGGVRGSDEKGTENDVNSCIACMLCIALQAYLFKDALLEADMR